MNSEIRSLIFCLLFLFSSCVNGASQTEENLGKALNAESDQPLEYRIGLFKDQVFNPYRVTHIIVVGSAMHEDSDQFFQSGLSRAYRYKELWPDRQIVIMSTPDVINRTDEQVFAKYNVKVIKTVSERFTAPLLIAEMSVFQNIASFDFFGHSSPWALKIDDYYAPFDPSMNMYELSELRRNFLPHAYVTLNGCNTGFSIAPNLSRALELPVSGSLTSSVFERLESDGFWYKENDQHSNQSVSSNKVSYEDQLTCATGACTRMRTSRHNYDSVWGEFKDGGLSFDKFFCNFEDYDSRCEKGMAMSLLGLPSVRPINQRSSVKEFKRVLFDWLCSTGESSNYFKKCVAGIEDAVKRKNLVYRSHPTNEFNCDFKSCNVQVKCEYDSTNTPKLGTCKAETYQNPYPTNVAREYLSFLYGFNLVRR